MTEQNTTAYIIFNLNLSNLEKSVQLLQFSLKDSIAILESNESELDERGFLNSDNITEAIEEQKEIEYTFYNQLYILLVSFLENYFEDLIIFDIKYKSESNNSLLIEGKKNIKADFELDFIDNILKFRRTEKIKFILNLLSISENLKREFIEFFKLLTYVRDSIVHNRNSLKKSDYYELNKHKERFSNNISTQIFNKDKVKFDSIALIEIVEKTRNEILKFDIMASNNLINL